MAGLFGFTPTQPGDNGKRWRKENDFNSRRQRQCGEKRSSDYRLCIEPTRQKKPKRSHQESRRHRVGAIGKAVLEHITAGKIGQSGQRPRKPPGEMTRHPVDGAQREQFERSEEHTSELQSLMRISYAVFCLNKKKNNYTAHKHHTTTTPQTCY